MLWTILGWFVWAFVAFLALGQWKWKFTHPDGGVRIISGRIAFVLTMSLMLTTMTDIHKLHLLWACPLLTMGARVVTGAIWMGNANRLISRLRAKSERTGPSMADMLHEEVTGQQRFHEPNTVQLDSVETKRDPEEEPVISSPAVMTLAEADRIIDIVFEALQEDDGLPYHAMSRLQGYDLFQFVAATKLRLANYYLMSKEMDDTGHNFQEEVDFLERGPHHVASLFVPDAERNKLRHLTPGSDEYIDAKISLFQTTLAGDSADNSRFLELETISSFAEYCRFIGASDPLYWQKIYSRIDLPYSEVAPQGNEPAWELICS